MPSEFSQAFGARSIHGVAKPVYRAMQLVRRLGNASVPVARPRSADPGIDVVVTKTDRGVAALLVHQPGGPGGPGSGREAVVAANINGTRGIAGPATTVCVEFDGSRVPSAAVVRRVDATHANALPAFIKQGAPPYPTPAQLKALAAASELAPERVAPDQTAKGWRVCVPMPPFGVATIEA